MRGGSVSGLLKEQGRLPVRWTALLLDQTLQALEAVHAADIVHRDVKPANLLLEPTGAAMPHLRLTDFGIAARSEEHTSELQSLMCISYAVFCLKKKKQIK